MTPRRFRAALLRSMIGFVSAPGRTRNAMWHVCSSRSTIDRNRCLLQLEFLHARHRRSAARTRKTPARYDAIPAALIGRLARDKKVRGEGVGDLLLADAVRRAIEASRSL